MGTYKEGLIMTIDEKLDRFLFLIEKLCLMVGVELGE